MKRYDSLCAFIVVTDTELAGQLALFDWKSIPSPDGTEDRFYTTELERDGRTYRLVLGHQREQGMVAATALSFKLIYLFRPQYLIMTGIAAGTIYEGKHTGEHQYGDVIVPNIVWNYACGKFVPPEEGEIRFGDLGFEPRPVLLTLDADTESCIRRAAASPENQCHIHFGPMACGVSVVANHDIVEKQVRAQISDTVGLDMESYAVMYAGINAGTGTIPIVIKSICDFADERKGDKYQRFAAYTSVEFAKLLVGSYLPVGDFVCEK